MAERDKQVGEHDKEDCEHDIRAPESDNPPPRAANARSRNLFLQTDGGRTNRRNIKNAS